VPFKSEAQRKFLYANQPEVAEQWSEEDKKKRKGRKDEHKKHQRAKHFEEGSGRGSD